MSRGRPTTFDFDLAERVIQRMVEGQGVNDACKAERLAPSTFRTWAAHDVGGLGAQYDRAQGILALWREDEVPGIIEAGGKNAEKDARWRLEFSERWKPFHLRCRG